MPSTVRGELERLGFDWEDGVLIEQAGSGYQTPKPAKPLRANAPVLDQRFSNGDGFVDVPRIMAADARAVYIPYKDRLGCGLKRIYHQLADYIETGEPIPFPDP